MERSIQDWIAELSKGVSSRKFPPIRRRRSKVNKRTIKKFAWDSSDNQFALNKIMNENTNEKIFLGVSDFDDLITSEILKRRVEAGQRTIHRETSVLCNREQWAEWAEEMFKDDLHVQGNSSNGLIIERDTNNYIRFDVNSNTVSVRAYGDADFADAIVATVESNFDIVTSHIEWVYGSEGNSVNVPLNRDRLPVDEMYPFLDGETLGDYYERYMASSANILLLIGPPGTGKTTFIRGLLAHTNSSAIVSYDSTILEKDGFFARFIESDDNVMVLEDSDAFLKSRTDGNTMMHRFLNVGDGLVTTKGKKMIFSTNLPSIRDVDSALVRPGRCFDILTFDTLNVEQANNLAKRLGVNLAVRKRGDETKPYSIAEVFNQKTEGMSTASSRRVGFI